MKLSPMRYKDFVWPHNPQTYTIEYRRAMGNQKVPYGRYHLEDMGLTRRVMKGEGIYQGVKPPAGVTACRDWKELLEGIQKGYGGWCIAECADGEGELCFYVGKVLTLEQNHLTLRPVGADGRWNSEAAVLPYEDLRTISFGGNYLRVYQKYTGGR